MVKSEKTKVGLTQTRSENKISCLDELRMLAETLGTQWKNSSEAEQLVMAQIFTLIIMSFLTAALGRRSWLIDSLISAVGE